MSKIIRKKWGHEEIIVNTELYCMKYLILKKDYFCSLHYHILKDETFYVDEGKVQLQIGDTIYILDECDSMRVPPGKLHRFTGIKDSVIIEVSTHDSKSDSVRIELSGGIEKNDKLS